MDQKRDASRQRTLKSGRIVFNDKSSVLDCTVRNLSARGACLEVTSALGVPASFDLLLDADGSTRRCDIVWKSRNRLGVSFS
jgi:hypothetical protein